MPISIKLQFLAPVAIGSEVTVFFCQEAKLFGGWDDSDPILFDHKTGIVFGHYWIPTDISPEGLYQGTLGLSDYRLHKTKPPLLGRVLRCVVRSKSIGEANDVGTLLLLEPITKAPEPYRG